MFRFRFYMKIDTGVMDDLQCSELLGCALGVGLGVS